MESKLDRCIITSASNKFFPSLINMLGSLHVNYPDHPDVFIYDLGLAYPFRQELLSIPWIHLKKVPSFVPFWRSCYTWKTYILNSPLAHSNLYLDAGCEILKSLNPLFKKIESQGYLAVSQGPTFTMSDVTPPEFFKKFDLEDKYKEREVITAGIFGFMKGSIIDMVVKSLYESGIKGDCLGYSKDEQWKNKGVNKTNVIPNCRMFRHDTTMISVFLYKHVQDLQVEPVENFSSEFIGPINGQYIWNNRLNFTKLNYVKAAILNSNRGMLRSLNRIYINLFLILKKINRKIKRLP